MKSTIELLIHTKLSDLSISELTQVITYYEENDRNYEHLYKLQKHLIEKYQKHINDIKKL